MSCVCWESSSCYWWPHCLLELPISILNYMLPIDQRYTKAIWLQIFIACGRNYNYCPLQVDKIFLTWSQLAHGVRMTFYERWNDVKTLKRRLNNVVLTSYACWVLNFLYKSLQVFSFKSLTKHLYFFKHFWISNKMCNFALQLLVTHKSFHPNSIGPVWKMVNTWQKILLYYPIPKIGVFGFLIPWAIGKKQKKTKKLRFLAGLRWFCLAIHAKTSTITKFDLTENFKNKMFSVNQKGLWRKTKWSRNFQIH